MVLWPRPSLPRSGRRLGHFFVEVLFWSYPRPSFFCSRRHLTSNFQLPSARADGRGTHFLYIVFVSTFWGLTFCTLFFETFWGSTFAHSFLLFSLLGVPLLAHCFFQFWGEPLFAHCFVFTFWGSTFYTLFVFHLLGVHYLHIVFFSSFLKVYSLGR